MDSSYGVAGGLRGGGGRRGGFRGRGGNQPTPSSPDDVRETLVFYSRAPKPHLDKLGNIVVDDVPMPVESQPFAPRGKGRGKGRGRGRGRRGGGGTAGVTRSSNPHASGRQNECDENDGMSQGSFGSTPSLFSEEVSNTDSEAAKALIKRERRRQQRQRQRERKLLEQIVDSQFPGNATDVGVSLMESCTHAEDSEDESRGTDDDDDGDSESDDYDDEGSNGREEGCMEEAGAANRSGGCPSGQRPPGSRRGKLGQANQRRRQRAEEIFLHILRSYQGRIMTEGQLADARKTFPDFRAMIGRFEASMFNVFKVQGQVRFVTVFHKKIRLCQDDRSAEGCSKTNCPFFHMCRNFIMGSCTFGDRCRYSHHLGDQGGAGLQMVGLGEAEILTLLSCSAPRLCQGYNGTSGCPDFACPDLHMCLQHVQRRCSQGEACCKNHILGDAEHNRWVLQAMHLDSIAENRILRVMLVQRGNAPHTTRQPPSQHRPRPAPAPAPQNAEKTSVDIFRYLLRTCHGRAITPSQFEAAQAKFPDFLSIVTRYETSKFRVYKENGKVVCVTAYHKAARACLDYNTKPSRNRRDAVGCQKEDCPFFHICKDFILGNCQFQYPRNCVFSHDLLSGSCLRLSQNLGLAVLEEGELRTLLACSRPRLCWAYSNSQGCRLPHCPDLHFCWNHFHRKCMLGSACPHSHTWQDEGHNACVLDLHRMKNFKDGLIFKSVFLGSARDVLPVESVAALPTLPSSLSHREEPAPMGQTRTDVICEKFVWSTCEGGTRCAGSHGNQRLPYAWQVNVRGGWKDTTPEWNVRLERDFCDFKTEVHGIQIIGESTIASVSLEEMTAMLGGLVYGVRRKSTPSFVDKKEDTPVEFYTRWQWRFDDDRGGPQLYEPDKLQATLEDKYLKGQQTYHFQREKFLYKLDFETMIQTNLETRKRRDVWRRPVFVSQEDVLYGVRQDSPRREAVPPMSALVVPPHWSPLDRWQDVELVELESSSVEYQGVRTHFYKTLTDKRRIQTIYRVQNPALWDQLQSQQRIMENQLRLEGRSESVRVERLFHGTDSLDVVRGICVQNFDHRLSGKNATVYGQGAYFAQDAKYSDNYTRGNPRYMFRAHVLVGDFTVGTSDMKRPPNRSGHVLYDSCVNNMAAPAIFVVFKMSQYYPEYLIEYTDCSEPEPPPRVSFPRSYGSSSINATGASSSVSSGYSVGRHPTAAVTRVQVAPSSSMKKYPAPAVPVRPPVSSPSYHSSSMYTAHRPPTPAYDTSRSSSSLQDQTTTAITSQPSSQMASPPSPRTQRAIQGILIKDRIRSTPRVSFASSSYHHRASNSSSTSSSSTSPTSHTPTGSPPARPPKSKNSGCVVM